MTPRVPDKKWKLGWGISDVWRYMGWSVQFLEDTIQARDKNVIDVISRIFRCVDTTPGFVEQFAPDGFSYSQAQAPT